MPERRPSWDEYFMELAQVVSKRSTCNRRSVGAVLARDKRILTTGYNGSPPGQPHCIDVGCLMVDGHCVRSVHAEQNAIIQGALHGIDLRGSIGYVTTAPCVHCAKMLVSTGVKRVVFADSYLDELGLKMCRDAGVSVERFEGREAIISPERGEGSAGTPGGSAGRSSG
jgi:dCMP deaminase